MTTPTQIPTISTDVATIFSWPMTMLSKFDISIPISMMETIVGATVIEGFMSGALGNTEMVYHAIIAMLIMLYVASAYVAYWTVKSAVNISYGFYYQYAGASTTGDNLAIYELIIFGGWMFWAFFQTVAGTWLASDAWSALDARVAEAKANSIGLENTLNGEKTIKAVVLHFLVGFIHLTVAYCLGNTAPLLVGWWDNYSDKTKTEGQDKDDFDYDRDGTAAREDFFYHLTTAIYGMFTFGIINFSSYVFYYEFLNLNGDDGFQCDLDNTNANLYSGAAAYAKAMKDRASCMTNIQKIFDLIDVDKDGMITRCEDAMFQYASGSKKEYALKFSSPYSRGSVDLICKQDFDN